MLHHLYQGLIALFRRVSAIEEKLGVRLFERLATGYVMTESGEAMLESGERIENEVLGLSRRLVGCDLHLSGVVRVAVPDALLMKVLMRHLCDFSRRYPEIQLELAISNNYSNLTRREKALMNFMVETLEKEKDLIEGKE